MYQCEFMKLPIERPEEVELFITDGVSVLTYCEGGKSKSTVPSVYNGVTIETIRYAYTFNTEVKSVDISEGIKYIE